jgi:predicted lipid-binding transport protein (Tim44 family)
MRLSDKKILSNETKCSVSLNLSYIVTVRGVQRRQTGRIGPQKQKRYTVSTQVLALIVFAVLAVVILLQLYNVLGRKVGFRPEEKPAGPKGEDMEAIARAERTPEALRLPNLETLKTRDVNFNEINFLEKARETYEQVVIAFHKGELDAIRDKLSEKVMSSFREAVDQRSAAPKDTVSFVDTPKADLDHIDFKEDLAQIRVRFLSELAYEDIVVPEIVVPEAGDSVVPVTRPEKSEKKAEPVRPHRTYKRTAEYWTFQKGMKAPSSPWLLTKVEAAKA